MVDSVSFLHGMQETYTERRAIGVAAGLAMVANEIESLRQRVAELEGKVMGYEAEMHAAMDYCREHMECADSDMFLLCQNIINCLGPITRPAPPEGT